MTKYCFMVTYSLIDSDDWCEMYFHVISDDFLEAWQEVTKKAFYTGVAYEMDDHGKYELQTIHLVSMKNVNI